MPNSRVPYGSWAPSGVLSNNLSPWTELLPNRVITPPKNGGPAVHTCNPTLRMETETEGLRPACIKTIPGENGNFLKRAGILSPISCCEKEKGGELFQIKGKVVFWESISDSEQLARSPFRKDNGLSCSAIAVTKHRDEGNFLKKAFNSGHTVPDS